MIIQSINGILLVLITGITRAITVEHPGGTEKSSQNKHRTIGCRCRGSG